MRTDDLVRLLAADARRTAPPRTLIILAVLASGAIACLALIALVGVRSDLLSALSDPRVTFKFAFAATAAIAAVAYGLRAIRPEDRSSPLFFALPVVALIAVGIALELSLTPASTWSSAAWGTTPFRCLGLIVTVALVPIAALLQALRAGAPCRPTIAGAAAGLGGGAIGAAVFALHCPNDSVLFVAIWYGLGIAIAGAVGAAGGRRRLAW
jgi:hypothetical protein